MADALNPQTTTFDWELFWSSFKEVLYLTVLAIAPLVINIFLTALSLNNLGVAINSKLVPFEILAYCLGFLAPSLYLLTKTSDSGYKLPFLHFFSLTTYLMYAFTLVVYLAAKNSWIDGIDTKKHVIDPYWWIAISFFFVTIIYRIYSLFHGKNANAFKQNRDKQQQGFNDAFKDKLTGQQ